MPAANNITNIGAATTSLTLSAVASTSAIEVLTTMASAPLRKNEINTAELSSPTVIRTAIETAAMLTVDEATTARRAAGAASIGLDTMWCGRNRKTTRATVASSDCEAMLNASLCGGCFRAHASAMPLPNTRARTSSEVGQKNKP